MMWKKIAWWENIHSFLFFLFKSYMHQYTSDAIQSKALDKKKKKRSIMKVILDQNNLISKFIPKKVKVKVKLLSRVQLFATRGL